MVRIAAATLTVLLLVVAWAPASHALNPFQKSSFDLSASDIELIRATTAPFFEDDTIPLGTEFVWSNGETGNGGTAILIDRFTYQDMPCRRIQHDIAIKGVADTFRYIIDSCQVADGSWKIL